MLEYEKGARKDRESIFLLVVEGFGWKRKIWELV